MKIYALYAGVMLAATGLVAPLQADEPPLRIVTVDMAHLYDNYHLTQEAHARFQEAIDRAQRETQNMMQEGNQLVEEYQELIESTSNPALSEEAQLQAQQRAQELVEVIRQKERELQQFQANTQRSLEQRQRNHQELMLDEIREVVMEEAGRREATLVLDISGATHIGIPPVIYADNAYDITDIVLEEINREAVAAE